ncbi:MAG: carbohydrate ABC transporter permease [Eubacteriales bacterium]|nr:carbohydrate ABC transporter permease [Eubacteriales bacterium]
MTKKKVNGFQVISTIVLLLIAAICIIPFILMVSASFTDNATVAVSGYSFIPRKFSLEAYQYLWKEGLKILRSVGISFMVTGVGTMLSIFITLLLAYPLSRADYPFQKSATIFVFLTMLFNGGMVPTYLVYTRLFHINNTYWALIIPGLLVNGFYVMLMRTYIRTSIPLEILEAARIDGMGEFQILFKMIFPLSTPIIATVGLLVGVSYWNDWYNALLYIREEEMYSLQVLLSKILQNAQFLATNVSMGGYMSGSSTSVPSTTVRMAIAVVGTIPILAVYPFFQKYFEKGLLVGAVKG